MAVRSLAAMACFLGTAWLLAVAPAESEEASPTKAGDSPQAVVACRDSEGARYSAGAVVQVGGQLMRCVIGPHWAPLEATQSDVSVLHVAGENLLVFQEAAILKALAGPSLPALACDAVLNSNQEPAQLLHVPSDQRLLMLFWAPTCGPCKPLLGEVAKLAQAGVPGLSILGVVQAADPDLEPPGEWQLLRVQSLMRQYGVGFPTCVHSSRQVAERWRAEGVPLMLLVSAGGVERVAFGSKDGHELLEQLAVRRDAARSR